MKVFDHVEGPPAATLCSVCPALEGSGTLNAKDAEPHSSWASRGRTACLGLTAVPPSFLPQVQSSVFSLALSLSALCWTRLCDGAAPTGKCPVTF